MKGNDYCVYLGDTLIGMARDVSDDMPNTGGRFEPHDEFASVRELFNREYDLLTSSNSEERRRVMDQIFSMGLRIVRQSKGKAIHSRPGAMPGPTFRGELAYLHIHDEKVWWRLM